MECVALRVGVGLPVNSNFATLISTCAGIIVTRVGGDEEGSHLGKDVGQQLTRHPKAIAITGCMLVLLGIIPGLPTIPFMLLAAAPASAPT